MIGNITYNKKTLFEYTVTIITISLFVISSYLLFGSKIKDVVTKSSCKLVGSLYVVGEKPGEGYCSNK